MLSLTMIPSEAALRRRSRRMGGVIQAGYIHLAISIQILITELPGYSLGIERGEEIRRIAETC